MRWPIERIETKAIIRWRTYIALTLLKEIAFKWKKDGPRRDPMELLNVAMNCVEFLWPYLREKRGPRKFVFFFCLMRIGFSKIE